MGCLLWGFLRKLTVLWLIMARHSISHLMPQPFCPIFPRRQSPHSMHSAMLQCLSARLINNPQSTRPDTSPGQHYWSLLHWTSPIATYKNVSNILKQPIHYQLEGFGVVFCCKNGKFLLHTQTVVIRFITHWDWVVQELQISIAYSNGGYKIHNSLRLSCPRVANFYLYTQTVVIKFITHCGWVTHECVSNVSLAQMIACHLVSAKQLSDPMLEYC